MFNKSHYLQSYLYDYQFVFSTILVFNTKRLQVQMWLHLWIAFPIKNNLHSSNGWLSSTFISTSIANTVEMVKKLIVSIFGSAWNFISFSQYFTRKGKIFELIFYLSIFSSTYSRIRRYHCDRIGSPQPW